MLTSHPIFVVHASARHIEEDILQIAAPIAREKFRWRRVVDEAALFQHDHPIAQAFDLRHIMRREQDRAVAVAPMRLEVGAHPIRRIRIERGCRLVEQQQFGIVDQCLGESHAGFLPRGEAPARTIEKLDEREILGEPRDFLLYVGDAIELARRRADFAAR